MTAVDVEHLRVACDCGRVVKQLPDGSLEAHTMPLFYDRPCNVRNVIFLTYPQFRALCVLTHAHDTERSVGIAAHTSDPADQRLTIDTVVAHQLIGRGFCTRDGAALRLTDKGWQAAEGTR